MNEDKDEINEAIISQQVDYYRFYLNFLLELKNTITHLDNEILLSWWFHQGEMSINTTSPSHYLGRMYFENNRMCFEYAYDVNGNRNDIKDVRPWVIEDIFKKKEHEKSDLKKEMTKCIQVRLNEIFNSSYATRIAEYNIDEILEERKNLKE